MTTDYDPQVVLDLWFPDNGHWESEDTHREFWQTRMHGGMDEVICREHEGLARAAAAGLLDHWAETPRGRLALLIALDQFPRSLWRDTPAAYGQDIKANLLVLEGLENGHYGQLALWEKQFFIIALSHCEGPDHMARMDLCVRLNNEMLGHFPPALEGVGPRMIAQAERVRGIIERFGRHPHRNPIYGRISTPEEQVYIETGDFPHVKSPEAQQS